MSDPISLVAIRSARFPSAFLRMDGSNVTQFQNGGSGTVNCQYYEQGSLPTPSIGNDEVFELIPLNPEENGNGRFAIRSLSWGAFLRIDASQVTQFQSGGSGTVNCQYYSPGTYPTNAHNGNLEVLIPESGFDGNQHERFYVIAPDPFEHRYLRMDGSQVTQFQSGGSGTVNCQWYPGPEPFPTNVQQYEALEIIPLTTSSPVVTPLP